MSNNSASRTYHPLFQNADAELTIRSSDDVYFRVHSLDFKRASPLFAGMIELGGPPEKDPKPIEFEEPSKVVEGLLRMISAMEIPSTDSLSDLKALGYAANKYALDGPLSIIRAAIPKIYLLPFPSSNSVPFFIETFGFLWEMGWQEEANTAAGRIGPGASLNFNNPSHLGALEKLPSAQAVVAVVRR